MKSLQSFAIGFKRFIRPMVFKEFFHNFLNRAINPIFLENSRCPTSKYILVVICITSTFDNLRNELALDDTRLVNVGSILLQKCIFFITFCCTGLAYNSLWKVRSTKEIRQCFGSHYCGLKMLIESVKVRILRSRGDM